MSIYLPAALSHTEPLRNRKVVSSLHDERSLFRLRLLLLSEDFVTLLHSGQNCCTVEGFKSTGGEPWSTHVWIKRALLSPQWEAESGTPGGHKQCRHEQSLTSD